MTQTSSPVSVLTNVVPQAVCKKLLRTLWEDFCTRGVSAHELDEWRAQACPFPHLRHLPLVMEVAVLAAWAAEVQGLLCEPQYIWHLPQSDHWHAPPPHVDEPPPWANGRPYLLIAGVALNPWHHDNGTLRYWEQDGAGPIEVALDVGDVVLLQPRTRHAAGTNHGTEIRAGVYFRWLQEPEVT